MAESDRFSCVAISVKSISGFASINRSRFVSLIVFIFVTAIVAQVAVVSSAEMPISKSLENRGFRGIFGQCLNAVQSVNNPGCES